MKKLVLVAKRKDGKFFALSQTMASSHWSYVDDPVNAYHVAANLSDIEKIHPAPYYFENSRRARDIWLVDCVMVPYYITTTAIQMVNFQYVEDES